MQTYTYKCPCCGSPLAYDGTVRKLECASCGNDFDVENLAAVQQIENEDATFEHLDWDMSGSTYAECAEARTYTCQSCGAELVTDNTTTATECAYCGSPIVLATTLNEGVRPEYILPFRVSEEEARRKFHDYFHGKRLIPNVFENSKNRISEIRRLYAPYWLFSCAADANVTYSATRVHVRTRGDIRETRTEYYLVRRTGNLAFSNIPVDGSEKLDNKITESLEPFDFGEAIPFTPAALAGSLADRADVEAEECRNRANERLRTSTRDTFRSTVVGYATVSERSCSIRVNNGKAVPVLLPIWMIRTDKTENGKTKSYTFAINGQTGKLTCDVPCSKSKAFKWFFGLTAAITAGGYALLLLLGLLGIIGGGGLA